MTKGNPPASVVRFAPSPTGLLHLGHAYAARFAWEASRTEGSRFLLRIEDIDRGRCRPEFEQAIYQDLAWLGLRWEEPVRRQSENMADYRAALDALERLGVLYPCFCTRKQIQAEIARSPSAPHGPDGPPYPGTCRDLSAAEREERLAADQGFALRLDVGAAARMAEDGNGGPLRWHDRTRGSQTCAALAHGDVVLARKDVPTSYHLAVTVDDALQGVTLVTRGEDLFQATHVHRLLQALLDLPTPAYHHHPLLMAADGRRFAKRDRGATLHGLRAAGLSRAEVWAQLEAAPA